MKIKVKGEGHSLTIPIPDGLLFSRLGVKTVLWICRKNGGLPKEMSGRDLERLACQIRRMVKKYGHWELVHVESADGREAVIITM